MDTGVEPGAWPTAPAAADCCCAAAGDAAPPRAALAGVSAFADPKIADLILPKMLIFSSPVRDCPPGQTCVGNLDRRHRVP
jgi:hypothetical protein